VVLAPIGDLPTEGHRLRVCGHEVQAPVDPGQSNLVVQLVFSLALTLGPWLGTRVYDAFGPGILWGATFLVSSLSAMMMLKLKRHTQIYQPEEI
jgi:predicted MFS family arabinose efflux permease